MTKPLSMSKTRVLAFCRPYLVPDFQTMFAGTQDHFAVSFLTDGRGTDAQDTCDAFYAAYAAHARCDALDDGQVEDIRQRCRLMRNLDRDEALRRIHAIALALGAALDQMQPDVVFCHLVDEYGLATLSHLTRNRKLPFVAYCGSFFSGNVLVVQNEHGLPIAIREPEEDDVSAALARLQPQDFRMDYNIKLNLSLVTHLRKVARYMAKRVWFKVLGAVRRDPLNMHYQITPYLGQVMHPTWYPRASHYSDDWRAELTETRTILGASHWPIVYMPLAFYPEASTNYWVQNRKMLEYEAMTIKMAKCLSGHALILVKEHPHMMGGRDPAFLNELKAIPSVISVPPLEKSNAVLDASDIVLLGAGSAGVEATVRGKPVLSFASSTYWFGASGATFVDLDRIDRLPLQVQQALADFEPMDLDARKAFVRACLASTMRQAGGGTRWPIMNKDDLVHVLQVSAGAKAEAGGMPPEPL
ncbi:hypothetical protein [Gymnodinialimonas hymeniacidonis]|uniref:hypothetical protein n=1 Tax=Gymnodinialimonas hymeniacidonis TaxID=3126508 RepID=UPI0034C5FAD4